MNLDTTTTIMLIAGAVLLYSAVKNKWPQDTVLEALGKKGSGKKIYDPDDDPNKWLGPIAPVPGGGGGAPPKFLGGVDPNNSLGIIPLYVPRV